MAQPNNIPDHNLYFLAILCQTLKHVARDKGWRIDLKKGNYRLSVV